MAAHPMTSDRTEVQLPVLIGSRLPQLFYQPLVSRGLLGKPLHGNPFKQHNALPAQHLSHVASSIWVV